ncbi:MAG: 1-phosphofructokinase family hexose kinase [Lachnospiraceae bacterium]|nr:1-phosphofructokinase family hexose kinase [Candidatus Darwinimomas equi]
MIITLTLNPSIDFIVHTDELKVNQLNRVSAAVCSAGSKGINVSKTLKVYGEDSVCVAVLAGKGGRDFAGYMDAAGVTCDYLWIDNGETRTNVKVMDKDANMTEINGPGPTMSESDVDALMKKLESYAEPGNIFVLGGSIVPGCPKDIYRKIIEMLHGHGAMAVLDADGGSLKEGIKASPDFLKPNRFELEQFYGLDHHADDDEIVELGRKMLGSGTMIAVSDGGDGCFVMTQKDACRVPVIPVEVRSCCGAGDSVVTGMIYGYEHGLDFDDTVRLAVATSTGAVTTEGTEPASLEYINELQKKVVIKHLK